MAEELEQFFGRLIGMSRQSLGSTLTVDAAVGATVLDVAETGDFDGDGGEIVTPDGTVYTYVSVDEEASTITLDTPLTAALSEDDEIVLYDSELAGEVVEYVGLVLLDDQDPGDEPIEVTIQHSLVNLLAETIRGGAAEAVTLVRDGDDDLMLWQVDGKVALDVALEQSVADLDETLTELNSDLNVLNTVTLPALQDDLATLDGKFPIGSTDISDGAISTPKLAANSVSADKIIANAVGADKIAANSIGADKIIANSIGADKLAANAVTAGKIAAGAVTADKLAAGALDGNLSVTASAILTNGNVNVLGTLQASDINMTGGGTMNVTGSISATSSITASGGMTAGGAVHGSTIYADSVPTTGAAINAVMGASGQFLMNTSSRRYKYDDEPFEIDLAAVRALVHKRFRRYDDEEYDETHPELGRWYYGVIAEEAQDLDLTPWLIFDADGQLQSFDYPGFATAVALAVARDYDERLNAQEQQIAALVARVEALESA